MIIRTLGEIAGMCGGSLVHHQDSHIEIQGVITDSRKIVPGCLFVPLTGERFDGHVFAAQALEQGAAGVLWERNHGQAPQGAVIEVDDTLAALQQMSQAYLRDVGCRVVGITGSNGKTTTKDMIYALLSTTYNVHKTDGNFNNHIGLPLTILSMKPEADIVVLEMGMSGRQEISTLSAIACPDVAVITNVGEAHLLQLGTREEIARAKVEIISGLKTGGLFIYNGDEPLIPQVLVESDTIKPQSFQTFTFGLKDMNDNYPTGMMSHSRGTIFTTKQLPERSLDLPLLGQHNVVNCLAALAVASHFGISEEAIQSGLSNLNLTSMRIEQLTAPSGLTILNDAYNASPTSMKAAIDVLQGLKGYRYKVAVLGDMLELGPKEDEFHAGIGEYAASENVDMLCTLGTLSEKAAEAARVQRPEMNVSSFTDKKAMIEYLIQHLGPKDIVLVKGSRGMKLEEVVDALTEANLHI